MKNLSFAILLFFMTTMTACIRQPDSLTSWISQVESHLSLEAGGKLIWESMKAHGGLEKWYKNGVLHFTWTYHMADRGQETVISSIQDVDPKNLFALHSVPGSAIKFGRNQDGYWISPPDGEFMVPPRFWTLTPIYFVGAPFVFADLQIKTELLEEIEFETKRYQQVKVTYIPGSGDSPEDYYILLIDPETKILRGMRYIVTSELVVKNRPPSVPSPETFITLDQLIDIKGIKLPSRHRSFDIRDGKITSQKSFVDVSELSFKSRKNVNFDAPDYSKKL